MYKALCAFVRFLLRGFVWCQNNCARCPCHLPCDWHMVSHVTQAACWWGQRNQEAIKRDCFHTTRRWMAPVISASDLWLLWQIIRHCKANSVKIYYNLLLQQLKDIPTFAIFILYSGQRNETVRTKGSLSWLVNWDYVFLAFSWLWWKPLSTGEQDVSALWGEVCAQGVGIEEGHLLWFKVSS